jgi:hypothetical protein
VDGGPVWSEGFCCRSGVSVAVAVDAGRLICAGGCWGIGQNMGVIGFSVDVFDWGDGCGENFVSKNNGDDVDETESGEFVLDV